jgi:hypothetical protein
MATKPNPKSTKSSSAAAKKPVAAAKKPAAADKKATAPAVSADEKQPSRSVLEALRHNQVGGLFAGLTIAVAVGLLLSVLVPSEPHLLALALLGALMAAAVGFTVRGTSLHRGLISQVVAFVATVIGTHLMTVTGMVGGELPGLPGGIGGDVSFNDAAVVALATPAVAVGPVLTGLIAAIIVGWGAPVRHTGDEPSPSI